MYGKCSTPQAQRRCCLYNATKLSQYVPPVTVSMETGRKIGVTRYCPSYFKNPCMKIRESSLTKSGSQNPTSTNMRHGMECEEKVHMRSGRTNSDNNQNVVPKAAMRTGAVAVQMLFENTVTGW